MEAHWRLIGSPLYVDQEQKRINMPRPSTLEICRQHLYSDIDQVPATYQERIKRLRVAYTFWYEFPTKTEADVRDHLRMNLIL